jgi:hypothetical protein
MGGGGKHEGRRARLSGLSSLRTSDVTKTKGASAVTTVESRVMEFRTLYNYIQRESGRP